MKRRCSSSRRFRRCLVLCVLLSVALVTVFYPKAAPPPTETPTLPDSLSAFAKEHHWPVELWPASLLSLYERHPEAASFVLHYPLKKDRPVSVDLRELLPCEQVPLLLQWDERWGYRSYAGELFGLSGCGPTCLSMVCLYLLQDASYTPAYIAEFAEQNGYSVNGNGSAWALIAEGGEQLGLEVTEIPLDDDRILRNLEAGNPIICIMGEGDFTSDGHFIVMTAVEDGKIRVNDPNSVKRSEQRWELGAIRSQIRNLWVCRA